MTAFKQDYELDVCIVKKSEGEHGNYFFFLKDLYFDGFVSILFCNVMSFPDLLWTKPEARIWSVSNGFRSAFDWLFHPPFREASAKVRFVECHYNGLHSDDSQIYFILALTQTRNE